MVAQLPTIIVAVIGSIFVMALIAFWIVLSFIFCCPGTEKPVDEIAEPTLIESTSLLSSYDDVGGGVVLDQNRLSKEIELKRQYEEENKARENERLENERRIIAEEERKRREEEERRRREEEERKLAKQKEEERLEKERLENERKLREEERKRREEEERSENERKLREEEEKEEERKRIEEEERNNKRIEEERLQREHQEKQQIENVEEEPQIKLNFKQPGQPQAKVVEEELTEEEIQIMNTTKKYIVVAQWDYLEPKENQISFKAGDRIWVTVDGSSPTEDYWWGEKRDGTAGYFPKSYVKAIVRKFKGPPQRRISTKVLKVQNRLSSKGKLGFG